MGKADDAEEEPGKCTPWTAVAGAQASEERSAENNVEKVPWAARAGSNLRSLPERGRMVRRKGEATGLAHEPVGAKTEE